MKRSFAKDFSFVKNFDKMLKFLIISIIITLYTSIANKNVLINERNDLLKSKLMLTKNFDKLKLSLVKNFDKLLRSI